MGIVKNRLIECAEREWRYFGGSTRNIENQWNIVGDEADEPFRSHISHYWASVGKPDWNGGTDEPWSAAFISWCFKIAGAGSGFSGDATHSVYINRIRLGDGMDPRLTLRSPPNTPLRVGDLIWNSRSDGQDENIPRSLAEATARLAAGDFFISHVDIVVAVGQGRCDSIGGNVSNLDVGGSVTKSTWRLDDQGCLSDPRKPWIGVVRNDL
ncbi:MAG: DUF2272 domain-containing protein [Alphaproteobacteria bacterium]|nr:MAG: DUF2272 domain-containing protein [Alphaproteobacteria bacterium]